MSREEIANLESARLSLLSAIEQCRSAWNDLFEHEGYESPRAEIDAATNALRSAKNFITKTLGEHDQ